MSRAKRLVTSLLLACVIVAGLILPSAGLAQDAFHITFGTSNDPQGRNTDGSSFAVQTENNDIVVAGNGASLWTDYGVSHTNPLIARISPDGKLRWQRIYREMEDQYVKAFVSRGEEQYMVLQRRVRNDIRSSITLRRIDKWGNISGVIGTLEGIWVLEILPVVDDEQIYFLIAAKKGATSSHAQSADVRLYRLDLQGQISEMSLAGSVDNIQNLQRLSKQEFLFAQQRRGSDLVFDGHQVIEMHTDVVRLSKTGEMEVLFTLSDKLCEQIVVSGDRVFCTEYRSFRRGLINDAIVAYSLDGRELWRHEIESNVSVGQMQPLHSGKLLYSSRLDKNLTINRRSRNGNLEWRQDLRSAGQYTFISAIQTLKDGRLAVLGSTGPWNGFVSTDTDAMLLVMDASGDEIRMPEVVSSVN